MLNQPASQPASFAKPILFAAAIAIAVIGCSESNESSARFTPIGEELEVRGVVTEAKLTVCSPAPDKLGTCEGTLTVAPSGVAAVGPVAVEVTRDVVLQKNGESVFLPQLRERQVMVRYRATKEGPKVATFVASP